MDNSNRSSHICTSRGLIFYYNFKSLFKGGFLVDSSPFKIKGEELNFSIEKGKIKQLSIYL